MIQLKIYKSESDVPPLIHQQILDFSRMTWSDGFQGKNRLRIWVQNPNNHPLFFLLQEEEVLIANVAVVWKFIVHKGIKYKMYALSGMMTYPSFRKQGYGLKIVNVVKEYMLKQDGDFIMIHSKLKGFYEKAGFESMTKIRTLFGNPKKPKLSDQSVFALFLTEKGKRGRKDFESEPFYFGKELW